MEQLPDIVVLDRGPACRHDARLARTHSQISSLLNHVVHLEIADELLEIRIKSQFACLAPRDRRANQLQKQSYGHNGETQRTDPYYSAHNITTTRLA